MNILMKGIIFDFNGTMFFDEKFQNMSWRNFLEKKTNRFITDDEFQEYIHGRNVDTTLSYFLNQTFSRNEIIKLEEEKEFIYRSMCLESPDFKLADGLPEFLDELTKRKIPITIATASGYTNVKFFFEYLHLDNWFIIDNVVFNDGTLNGKPEPDLYLKAAKNIGADINKCIIFEDSKSGIESARRANAYKIIGVASMQSPKALLESGVAATINDYKNTEKLLEIIEC
ncbi:MAG: HAD family phosphatase [Lachnospiraceae bacterium]|nr:HAD family phosphatase [Lachnospiraceae bacterium]